MILTPNYSHITMDASRVLEPHVKTISFKESEELRKNYNKKMRGYDGGILLSVSFAVIFGMFAAAQYASVSSAGFIACTAIVSFLFVLAVVLNGSRPSPENGIKVELDSSVRQNYDSYFHLFFLIYSLTIVLAVGSIGSYQESYTSVVYVVCLSLTSLCLVLLCIIGWLFYISPDLLNRK